MITSQKCHLRHKLRIFLFHRKVMFCSGDIQVFLFLTVPWFIKSVTSWLVLVHEAMCIFEYILNHNSLMHQTCSIDKFKQGQYFSEIFWMIWRTKAKFHVFFNLATCSHYSLTNYVKFYVFHLFERVNKGELKIVKINY